MLALHQQGSAQKIRVGSPLTHPEKGLSEDEAAARLQRLGYNELASAKTRGVLAIALGVVREPMFVLLVICGAIYLTLGNRQEALMLLGFVFVVMGITLFQENKAERALQALRNLASPRARVIRGGESRTISGREVIPGDIVLIAEGDRVPADAVLLEGTNLMLDESLLTGESVPVQKLPRAAGDDAVPQPGGDNSPFVFSGTLVVQGNGMAQVIGTGPNTAIGRIGKSLFTIKPEVTRVQRETATVVKRFAFAAGVLAVVAAGWYGVTRADWFNGFLVGLTLAMAILPEELPVVLTIFLGLGGWRLAQSNVLARRVAAIEMLGAATVLCVDKTGTLTQNEMTLTKLAVNGESIELTELPHGLLPETYHELLEFSILASHRDPFDPMEKAIHKSAQATLAQTEHLHSDWELVNEYPLSPELLAMSRVWQSSERRQYVVAAKGAPEAIADLCHFDAGKTAELDQQVRLLAQQGLRVLGVAKASFQRSTMPAVQHDFAFEFLGLIGLRDPVRPTVPAAIREAQAAGIRVVMMTGDYQATAMSIAAQAGLDTKAGAVSGQELDSLTDTQLSERIAGANVFYRVAPEQKLRLVSVLKARHEVVAMTGDGVNDAPALKAAHIGIAMGGRGTDVAREAAALVLLDDDFSSIVRAVRLGRRIFDNLRKAITFVVAVHVPIIGLSLIPVGLGWPLVLMPVHILFLQLIIDPACSIVFEAEPDEADLMARPPRSPTASLFDRATLTLGCLQGGLLLAIVLGMYGLVLQHGKGAEEARALAFTTLVVANLGLIFVNRSRSRQMLEALAMRNPALWWISGLTVVFLGLVDGVAPLRELFYFSRLHWNDLALCITAGLFFVVTVEVCKRVVPAPTA
ncbi:cation-translocating P-type ATPase [Noviherbaspirillum pedocola]|uniref:Cation-translocating P-type ATPase n=1 Tax=Noviherbaspirillum pedocola TaxID=2801341 RepID=A0A934WAD1_9BURK|nr:cation-translocating P-type ATPase [Noviherbaspirillum pedocola]MBK4738594.1 cation-translocating P-type ATPase [Noviherbaspirillum pedocola]